MHVYIYIYREREKEISDICYYYYYVYIYIYIHTYTCIYLSPPGQGREVPPAGGLPDVCLRDPASQDFKANFKFVLKSRRLAQSS